MIQQLWELCAALSAPRDPLCGSQDLCHCPHSTQNNFCCAFFCLNCLWPFLLKQKRSLLFDIFADAVWKLCDRPVLGVYFFSFVLTGYVISKKHCCSWYLQRETKHVLNGAGSFYVLFERSWCCTIFYKRCKFANKI